MKTPSEIIKKLSGGRLTVAQLARLSGLSRETLGNWTRNPDRQKALKLIIAGAMAGGEPC